MAAIYVKCHSVRILRILKSKFQNLKIQFNRQLGQVNLLINLTWVGVNRKNNCNFYPLRNVICLWSLSRRPSLWSPIELNLNLSLPRCPTERAKKELLRHGLFLIIPSRKEKRENWSKLVSKINDFWIWWEVKFLKPF